MRVFLFLSVVFMISCGKNPDVRTIWHNHKSIKLLNDKNPEASQKDLVEALSFDPFQPEVHLNLGLNFEILNQNDNALKQYATVEKYSNNSFQVFVSRFNRAQLLAREKKIEEALAVYQSALEIAPTSKEVKTNIELLSQQQQGGGQGKDDQNQKKDDKSQDDKKNENGDDKDQKEKDKDQKDKENQKKDYKPNQKYQPREFKGELSKSDVKKILDELKQQEQKIRAEYNKKNDYKERPRGKDW